MTVGHSGAGWGAMIEKFYYSGYTVWKCVYAHGNSNTMPKGEQPSLQNPVGPNYGQGLIGSIFIKT